MTFQVPRHDEPQVFGLGLIKGLLVTMRHFVRSYQRLRNKRIPGEEPFPGGRFGIFTVQYPEESGPVPERYRGLPIQLYDDETGAELCTACGACARDCPLGIIHFEQAVNEEGKKIPFAESFAIEHGVCMNCGFCADACAFGAIVLDHRLETASPNKEDFWVTKEQLLHPASYYEKLAPTIWGEMKENVLKRLAGTLKRRPEGVGIVKR
jgi:formate hydrogenlyase subunit 6/NADH:ubiquinone oxidoreductase subunit I